MNNTNNYNRKNTPALAGLILVAIGFIWMLSEMNIHLPYWLIQPYTFLIAIGIYLGVKRNFQAPFGWMLPLGIGFCWLVAEQFNVNIWRFGFPAAMIGAGLFIIINAINKPKILSQGTFTNTEKKNDDVTDALQVKEENPVENNWQTTNTNSFENNTESNTWNTTQSQDANTTNTKNQFSDDRLDITTIFSSTQRSITTKNFKGGDIVSIMGGTDLNFIYADMQSPAIIDLTVMMGGVKIVVPPNWEIKNNVTAILGGVEDRRPPVLDNTDKKILVLKGTVIMGGIDIRNF